MNKNKTNRREFLGIAGLSLAGLAVASVAGLPQVIAKESASRQSVNFEQWLLNTGADDLPKGIYQKALEQLS
jgi:DMSO/TMAO reductase YedYZ molybdopterin-dependent catalytic subunit